MKPKHIFNRLEHQAAIIKLMVEHLSEEQWRWKPKPEKWSVLEVINHLVDEERDDFRMRIDLTLHQPGTNWPPIDPPQWAIDRKYNQRDPQQSLWQFGEERRRSLDRLRCLSDPDWLAAYEHPKIGILRAGDLLLSWATHDLLHIRQLSNLLREWNNTNGAPFSDRYAGP